MLIATAKGEVVAANDLAGLTYNGDAIGPPLEPESRLSARGSKLRNDRALQSQRARLETFIKLWCDESEWDVRWEGNTRSVVPMCTGFYGVIGEQLRGIFAAPDLDMYDCSLCGKLFHLDATDRQRKPGPNTRIYCGADCRRKAKLASNSASRQRNAARWPSRSGIKSDAG